MLKMNCKKSKSGIHDFEVGDTWGVLIGVSRCKECGDLAKEAHFKSQTQDLKHIQEAQDISNEERQARGE